MLLNRAWREEDAIRVRFQRFEFDLESGELWKDSTPVRLQPQPAKVLRLLVERAGKLVSREDIQKVLWEDETFVDYDQGLNYCIRQIRIVLAESAEHPSYIVTVPRRGYRFDAEISIVATEPASPLSPHQEPDTGTFAPAAPVAEPATPAQLAIDRQPRAALKLWQLRRIAVGAGILLMLAALIYFGSWRRHLVKASVNAQDAAADAQGTVRLRTSVAVLGFANLNGKSNDEWLSTALSEMLSTELSEGGKLRLISGEEVAKAQTGSHLPESLSPATLGTLRQELGTDLVVFGTHTSLAQGRRRRVRLDVRLQDTRNGQVLAAFSQTGDEADLFDLVGKTGAKLRQQLGAQELSPVEEAAFDRSFPSDPDARRFYAAGLERLRNFDALGARTSLELATKTEPQFAPARSALAAVWSALGYDARAAQEARKAAALTAGLPREEQLSIEARYYEIAQDNTKATDTLRSLLSFFPDNLEYGIRLATVQLQAGHSEEALATVATLRLLPEPLGSNPRLDLLEARIHSHDGNFKLARDLSETTIAKGRTIGAKLLVAQGLTSKSYALERLGLLDESVEAGSEARRINAEAGFVKGVAQALLTGGNALYDKGDFNAAREHFESALNFFREIGDRKDQGLAIELVGNVYHDQGKLIESRNQYRQALDIYQETQWMSGVCSAMGNLANTLDALGDLKGSLKMHQQALVIFRQTGQKRGEASEIDNVAAVSLESGDFPASAAAYHEAIRLHRETGYKRGEMFALSGLGDLLLLQNDLDGARTQYQAAHAIAEQAKEKNDTARLDTSLAAVDFYQGNLLEAESLLHSAAVEFQKNKDPEDGALAYATLTRTLLAEGKQSEAAAAAKQAEAYAGQVSALPPKFEVGLAVAHLEAATGKKALAEKTLLPLLGRADEGGYVQYALETRRELIGLEAPESRKVHLAGLGNEAKQKGFGLIAAEVAKMPRQ